MACRPAAGHWPQAKRFQLSHGVTGEAFLGLPITTLAITNGPDFLLIGRAGRVCRIWFDRDQSEDSRVVPIVPYTAYTTGMTNRQTGSKDDNIDSPLVIASPPITSKSLYLMGLRRKLF